MQTIVSLSSVEAEYRSMHRIVAELTWLTRLLPEMGVPSVTLVPLHCDSQVVIHIAHNLVFHKRTKHIDLDYHFVHEKLLEGLISLTYVPTRHQLANVFTKTLPDHLHCLVLDKLGVTSPLHPLMRGGGVGLHRYLGHCSTSPVCSRLVPSQLKGCYNNEWLWFILVLFCFTSFSYIRRLALLGK
ncbi:hypothetical protein Dimus_038467 [Dionaea muscipula]